MTRHILPLLLVGLLCPTLGATPLELSTLRKQISQARAKQPTTFRAVAGLRSRLPSIAARQRGRLVTVVLPLRSLGPAALLPMLASLDQPRGALTSRAWRGWRVSLLEAVGSLRDARSRPLLEAILSRAAEDPVVWRGAARALARLGDERALKTLLGLTKDRTRLHDLVPALGECRRLRCTRALAALLRQAGGDRALAARAVAALGQTGNAWAWKTPAVARSGEGEATRRTAVEALVEAYPTLDASARDTAVKAVALVGHPRTGAIIAAARARSEGPAAEALDELSRRVKEIGLLR